MSTQLDLAAQLEAILFWKGEPVSIKRLAELTKTDTNAIVEALGELERRLTGRGVQLIFTGEKTPHSEVMLGTAAVAGPLIETLTKEELIKDLGKAGSEVLAIVLYRGPVSRKDIEYIRGVNCSYIIRNLLIRGLIEKTETAKSRSTVYAPTTALLSYLGISYLGDLPEFKAVQDEIQKGIAERQAEQTE